MNAEKRVHRWIKPLLRAGKNLAARFRLHPIGHEPIGHMSIRLQQPHENKGLAPTVDPSQAPVGSFEYVKTDDAMPMTSGQEHLTAAPGSQDTLPFLPDQEISKESLEAWIAAGLLYPEEIRQAEKRIKTLLR